MEDLRAKIAEKSAELSDLQKQLAEQLEKSKPENERRIKELTEEASKLLTEAYNLAYATNSTMKFSVGHDNDFYYYGSYHDWTFPSSRWDSSDC